jgi:hypothetical protein
MTGLIAKTGTRVAAMTLALAITCVVAGSAEASWTTTASGSATATSAAISPPTGVAGSCGVLSASVRLDWTASTSSWTDGYEIQWRRSPSPTYTNSATVTGVTYTTPALSGGTYFFLVRATKGAWRSSNVTEVSKSIVSILGLGLVCS